MTFNKRLIYFGIVLISGITGITVYIARDDNNKFNTYDIDIDHVEYLRIIDNEWVLLNESVNELYDPWQIELIGETIFVWDAAGKYPILLYNLHLENIGTLGEWGKGPGEFVNPIHIIGSYRDTLVIHERMMNRLSLFDITTKNFVRYIDLFELVQNYVLYAALSKNLVITVDGDVTESFAKGYNIFHGTEQDAIYYGDLHTIPELEPVTITKNFSLKEGAITSDDNNFYVSLRRSSLLMGFSSGGDLLFHNSEPHNIDLPEYADKNYQASQPPVNWYPTTYISIDNDDNFLYSLYSGRKLSQRDIVLRRNYLIHQSHILDIYDKYAGNYQFSTILPLPLSDMVVTDKAIYGISKDPEIKVVKFKKPEFMRRWEVK